VEYTLPITYWEDEDALEDGLAKIMLAERLECTRGAEGKEKEVDIRPAIYKLKVEGEQLVMTLGLGEGGYAKPIEVVEYLKDDLTVEIAALPFHRRDLYRIDAHGQRIDVMDL
jgi:hypothetical protein